MKFLKRIKIRFYLLWLFALILILLGNPIGSSFGIEPYHVVDTQVRSLFPGITTRTESSLDNSGNNLVIIYSADYDDTKVFLQMNTEGSVGIKNMKGETKGIMFWKDGELSCSPVQTKTR